MNFSSFSFSKWLIFLSTRRIGSDFLKTYNFASRTHIYMRFDIIGSSKVILHLLFLYFSCVINEKKAKIVTKSIFRFFPKMADFLEVVLFFFWKLLVF